MNDNFIIPLNGLAVGKTSFEWTADKEFFENFENLEIIDAELKIDLTAEKSGSFLGIDADIEGKVTVECDRCLEDLVMPVETSIKLSVKYGDASEETNSEEQEREVIMLPEDEVDLDMSQIIYDYVCLSLPIQRYHKDGECNPEAIKHLNGENLENEKMDSNNPFAKLKGLLNN